MNYFKKFENFIQNPEIDYSGEYYNLRDFINRHDLQNDYVKHVNIPTINIDNWSENIEDDETYITTFLGDTYHIFYDESIDSFEITKKKGELYDIISVRLLETDSEKEKAHEIIRSCGIWSEYEGRIGAFINDEMVGTVSVNTTNNKYWFDIGINPLFQGYGISSKLILFLIEDAKSLNSDSISAQVTNMKLAKSLKNKYGFELTKDSGQYFAYLNLKNNMNENYKPSKQETLLGLAKMGLRTGRKEVYDLAIGRGLVITNPIWAELASYCREVLVNYKVMSWIYDNEEDYTNDMEEIKWINANGKEHMTDLTGLEPLLNLKELYCSNSGLISLKGIGVLKNIEILEIGYNNLTSLKGIGVLKLLKKITCYANPLPQEIIEWGRSYELEKIKEYYRNE